MPQQARNNRANHPANRALAAMAAAVLLSVVPLVAHAGAAPDDLASVQVVRYGGADRYATSLGIAEAFAAEADGSLDTVVMVSGVHWTDAVVAASVAGRFDAPVLMTPPDRLLGDTLVWLSNVGVERVVVVSADPPDRDPTVSADVTDALRLGGFDVERVSGNDQYRTGVAAAQRLGGAGGLARFGPTAIIASGEVFADALVAGPLAAKNRLPLLLTPKMGLHPDVSEYLTDAGVKRVVLMGGTAALSADVQSGIEALGIIVDRMAGATRFETATKFAAYAARHGGDCWADDEVGLARAFLPFDSFSAAPLLAQLCAPAVLTDPAAIPDTTTEFLNEARQGHERITLRVFGGDAAVSQDAIDTYLDATEPTADGNYKNRSENSVLPATDRYFIDHDEAAALFPGCPPPPSTTNQNTLRFRRELQERYAGFDTEITTGPFGSTTIDFTTGWWTDDALRFVYGPTYPEIDVAWAKQNITMWAWNQIGFGWRAQFAAIPGEKHVSADGFRGVYERIVLDGYDESVSAHEYVHHLGAHRARRVDIDNDKAWIADGGQLLWNWAGFMHAFPPVDREPAAWGMQTLLTTRHASCVARETLKLCDAPFSAATSPHLRNDEHASPLGIALWNLVCGEHPQT
ncbi:cell wall-binding repeat-containing protein [Candidatus Poriferisodalis sp.]|uniref:cell wall-binding repeat-containing protein n=1 Tax=Candidatus Poriferisodalis sp. TaxID=3101277 RepID=UPI003D145518